MIEYWKNGAGMFSMGGGRFDRYDGSALIFSSCSDPLCGPSGIALDLRGGKRLMLGRGSWMLVLTTGDSEVSSKGSVVVGETFANAGDATGLMCITSGVTSTIGADKTGSIGGSGGTTSVLPFLLPAALLRDGCRDELDVDGRDPSPSLCVVRPPTEAERAFSCSNVLEDTSSGVCVLLRITGRGACSFFLGLPVGNGGNAQSRGSNISAEGGRRPTGVDALRGGCR